MQNRTPPRFLTLDVDLVSREDLEPIAKSVEEPAYVLGLSKIEDFYYLSLGIMSIIGKERNLENCAMYFLEMVSCFPSNLANLWNRAESKTFDFGFESGLLDQSYRGEITPETLAKISSIGAGIAVSIYPTYSANEQRVENQNGT